VAAARIIDGGQLPSVVLGCPKLSPFSGNKTRAPPEYGTGLRCANTRRGSGLSADVGASDGNAVRFPMVAAESEPLTGDALIRGLLQLHRPLNDDEAGQLVG